MNDLMKRISQLPEDIQNLIYEYNVEHREKMKWALKDILENIKCENCNKRILKLIYSERNMNMTCCSVECVDDMVY
jgi:hypothetical protein